MDLIFNSSHGHDSMFFPFPPEVLTEERFSVSWHICYCFPGLILSLSNKWLFLGKLFHIDLFAEESNAFLVCQASSSLQIKCCLWTNPTLPPRLFPPRTKINTSRTAFQGGIIDLLSSTVSVCSGRKNNWGEGREREGD